MRPLAAVAPAFVEMAHRIVWCAAASVAPDGRPRSRVLHPLWEWDADTHTLGGWIATAPTRIKRTHFEAHPYLSLNYWHPSQDTCVAECRVAWHFDPATREAVWDAFKTAPAPVGYDPAIIPGWDSPASESFAALRLEPWRLRVMPGSALLQGQGEVLVWEREGS